MYGLLSKWWSIDAEPSPTCIAKCWSKYKNHVYHDSTESYYKRSVAVIFLGDIISQVRDRKKGRSHIQIFKLLLSVMFAKGYNIEKS